MKNLKRKKKEQTNKVKIRKAIGIKNINRMSIGFSFRTGSPFIKKFESQIGCKFWTLKASSSNKTEQNIKLCNRCLCPPKTINGPFNLKIIDLNFELNEPCGSDRSLPLSPSRLVAGERKESQETKIKNVKGSSLSTFGYYLKRSHLLRFLG